MSVLALRPEPLEPDAFAPFGSVIRFDAGLARPVNEGTALRADTAALFDTRPGTRPRLALYRTDAQAWPLRVSLFERHPEAAQSFVSLDVALFLVVVAPPGHDGKPDRLRARAFLGRAGMGMSYRVDQWHTPILALGTGGDLLMLMAEHGDARDCIEHRLDAPLLILEP
ncbi:ureidoglycolate lyase [Lichenihabitans sp. Uapishka_5]|uniref:ureidoglycolate lyase n=1 Tax=Lichenihabitans sp. Uapishka_5 TaxID=3037302 RepID=UPI0029E7D020|nr:ureidoglycolate lyase [Lichenihabitans sp. Uapishka_5]MDX7950598.1 ureidoglycolate lyase [Lichenihabitans sp. Uapishka_5]